ncbi:creatininase family protein [Devosia sp. 63-57]|uniref:creatininase family protein n=1 Tax=Devosia sp. 63-57 TaxID=1895751 RepID=UPI00086B7E0A|nr:creatininase family protein [Devosia sp. 63-57]ODT48476.1 MAG: creatinine amidohydrolase [Pelagibacterium sp. SCN 63-126]ODU85735.1 MAG: creatinine amidohydrolase [Pelagibacterium sp. SCN 63-17]OJX43582.1 MAG: creatinine amidohydrolase [Devosia sp. 63-57]
MSAMDLSRTSWPDIAAQVKRGTLAVLALGACEQHGAHLPVTTDTDMAHGTARRLAEALGALLLPPIAYGDAFTASSYPGTISISPRTLQALIEDIGHDLKRTGILGLVLVNGHFGNREPMVLAARTLAVSGLPVCHLDYPGLERLAGDICDSEPAAPHFYHADEVETAIMLAVSPEGVDMARAEPSYPQFPVGFGTEPMQLRDFNPSGVFGDPRPATAAKGEALLRGIVAESLIIIAAWCKRHSITGGARGQSQ